MLSATYPILWLKLQLVPDFKKMLISAADFFVCFFLARKSSLPNGNLTASSGSSSLCVVLCSSPWEPRFLVPGTETCHQFATTVNYVLLSK